MTVVDNLLIKIIQMRFILAILISFLVAVAAGGISHLIFTPGEPAPQHPDPLLHLIATANIERGERLSKACETCHNFEKGKVSLKEGPNLWEVVGAPKASVEGFKYSQSLKETGGTWTYSDLNRYLWNPKYLVPEGSMSYIGMRKPQDRADLIAWLRTLSDSPHPLPSEEEIAIEHQELTEAASNHQ